MKLLNYLILLFMVVCIWIVLACFISWSKGKVNTIEKQLNTIEKKLEVLNNDTEITDLQNVQNIWIKQTKLLATVSRLSSNLQAADLEHRELADVLSDTFEENQMLKSKLQQVGIIIGQLLKENESLRAQLKPRST